MFTAVGLIALSSTAQGLSFDCYEDSSYVNSWDGYHSNVKSDYYLNGQYSYHDNGKEDRLFKWRYCKPLVSTPIIAITSVSQTPYDDEWSRSCSGYNGGNSVMVGGVSTHDNGKEDRIWTWYCGYLNSDLMVDDCTWTDYLNDWDGVLDYDCGNSGAIRSIESYHDNGKEDRRWKFECCNIVDYVDIKYVDMVCDDDDQYVNDWDGYHNNVQSSQWLNGQYSYHDNGKEDRLFKWRYCKPDVSTTRNAVSNSVALDQTDYDATWTRSCSSRNGGHSAMLGATSSHDNGKEDRVWTWYCGDVDTGLYSLTSCSWTGYLNSWDGVLDYDCPNNGVIRQIWSQHDNGKEDRLWKFECCRMATFSFGSATGYWSLLTSCNGCDEITYEESEGIERSESSEFSQEYTDEVSVTIEAGYEYLGASGSVSVTGTVSSTTASVIASSLTHSLTVTRTATCSKTYFFQWRQDLTESLPEIGSTTISVHASQYLCTDNAYPQCPAGWCSDSDCTTCKSGYSTAAVRINDEIEADTALETIEEDTGDRSEDGIATMNAYLIGAIVAAAVLVGVLGVWAVKRICFSHKKDGHVKVSPVCDDDDVDEQEETDLEGGDDACVPAEAVKLTQMTATR